MTVLATDDFNRADSANLGANWTVASGMNAIPLVSNHIDRPSNLAINFYNAVSSPNDQYSQIVLTLVSTVSDDGMGPAVRCNSSGDAYIFQCTTVESRIYKVTGGASFAQLGSDGAAFANNDVAQLVIQGNTLTGKKNGTTVITTTDSSFATGSFGLWATPGASQSGDSWEGGSPTAAIDPGPGTTIQSQYNDGFLELGISRVQNFFRPQTGIIPLGQKIYNIPFTFQHVEAELGTPRVQSQFKGQAGVQPGPTAGYRTYNRISNFQADPTELGIEKVPNIFIPKTGITPATQQQFYKAPVPILYAQQMDDYTWAVFLASAGPGVDPPPPAVPGKFFTNDYIEELDFKWNNTSINIKPRTGIIPPPTKPYYTYIFTNPLFVDLEFAFENAAKTTGNKFGIPGAIPYRVVRALSDVATQIQNDINEFPRLFLGIRVHSIIGAPPPPDPTGNLLKRQNVGVGVKLQGG